MGGSGPGGPGFMGGSGPGGPGFMGGGPGMPGPGMPGSGLPGTAMLGGHPSGPDPNDVWVHICLEIRGKAKAATGFPMLALQDIEQKWFEVKGGHKPVSMPIFPPLYQKGSPFFQLFEIQNTGHKYDPLPDDFGKRFRKAKATKKEDDLIPVAAWALRHGLVKEFHLTMDEIGKQNATHAIYLGYVKLRDELKKSVRTEDPAIKDLLADLKKEGYREFTRSEDGSHYAILTKMPSNPTTDSLLRRRLERLEDNLQVFYYWFLLQRTKFQPSMPKHQLAVVLVGDPIEFQNRYAYWGEPLMHEDGFTPRRDNIMILSSQRLDEEIVKFDTELKEVLKTNMFKNIHPDEFITADLWKRNEAKMNAPYFAIVQMLAIIHKALIEEGERATLTHEGSRQLLVASGVLPRNVRVPEWLMVGLSSYFETPVGAPYTSIGAPHWNHAIAFEFFRKSRKLNDKANPDARSQLLVDVVTDRVFHKVKRMQHDLKDSKNRDEDSRKVRQEAEFARSAAWALTYYLIKDNQFDRLVKYREELSKLPRDLPLDDKTLKRLFAQSFQLHDKKGSGLFDEAEVRTMAGNWFAKVDEQPIEIPFLQMEGLRLREQAAAPRKTPPPMHPTGPGGVPGMPPGFPP